MKTKEKDIIKAGEVIKNGGIAAFPTETVYGIGADATNENAIKKIFEIKNRPFENPLIVHINSIEMLEKCVTSINEIEEKIINLFWPGPLTIIFKKNNIIPGIVTSNLNSVAVRMPDYEITLKLIKYSNCPVAAPSANKFGKLSPILYREVIEELGDEVDYVLKGDVQAQGIESTVIRVQNNELIEILRPGPVTKEILEEKLKLKVEGLKKHPVHKLSPGTYRKHYSPDTSLRIIYNKNDLDKYIGKNLILGYITYNKNVHNQSLFKEIVHVDLKKGLNFFAEKLYSLIRKLDKKKLDYILIDAVDEKKLGIAIMDRLRKAEGKGS